MCITIFGLVLMQPVVSFLRVFCGIGSFFVLCPALPVPLVRCKSTLLPYRRGGCSLDAKQPKEQEQEAAKIHQLQKEVKSIEVVKSVKLAIFKTSERIRDLLGVELVIVPLAP